MRSEREKKREREREETEAGADRQTERLEHTETDRLTRTYCCKKPHGCNTFTAFK